MSVGDHGDGFTIIELIAVMVLVSVLSISATPALRWMDRARHTALRNEIERRLVLARSYACTSGQPAGVQFDLDLQELRLRRIEMTGGLPSAMPDIMGNPSADHSQRVASFAAGAAIEQLDLEDSGTFDTIWFNYDGTPHFRNDVGEHVGNAIRDAEITISGGYTVIIRQSTGLVEVAL